MRKRFVSAVLAFLLILSSFVLNIGALELDDYEVSVPYKNSDFYKNVTSITLTGDGRYDTVAVALSQLGYHEGNKDADMHGGNQSGGKNFVEYNRLFGKLDNGEGNGTSYGYAWCASFINWCLRAANVAVGLSGAEVSCSRWITFLTERSRYKTRKSGYEPICGDLIFFKDSGSSFSSTHIGIVIGYENGIIYTVEGNSGGVVGYHNYLPDNTYIVGYGVPKYKTNENADYSDFELVDVTPLLPGEYYVNYRSVSVKPQASISGKSIGKLSINEIVNITQLKNGYGKIDYDGQTGWIQLDRVSSVRGLSCTLTYDTCGGNDVMNPQIAKYKNELTLSELIPEKEGYNFIGWASEAGKAAEYNPGGVITLTEDTVLYAVWQEAKPAETTGSAQVTETNAPENTVQPKSNITLIVIIGFTAFIIAGGITLFLMLKPKKEISDETTAKEQKKQI